jgi:hypothetical protein
MYHQRQGLLMIYNRCWRCILDWFLYAQLLNKKFEQTITIAQKISGVETSKPWQTAGGVNIQEYLNID